MTTVNAARVLITGASRGLGHALAAELHGRGYDVVATPRALSDVADLDARDKGAARCPRPAAVLPSSGIVFAYCTLLRCRRICQRLPAVATARSMSAPHAVV